MDTESDEISDNKHSDSTDDHLLNKYINPDIYSESSIDYDQYEIIKPFKINRICLNCKF